MTVSQSINHHADDDSQGSQRPLPSHGTVSWRPPIGTRVIPGDDRDGDRDGDGLHQMEVRLRLVNIIGLDQKAEAVHFTNHTVFWPDLLCEFYLV